MKEKDIQRATSQIVEDVIDKANLKQGAIFVLGLSSSEVIGGQIGKGPIGKEASQEIGEVIVKTILAILEEKGIHLAVQGCEHVNRALVVERQVAEQFGLEIVSVLPTLHAGGSGQLAAFKFMQDPVEVEFIKAHAGLDIGDTAIGMHVKHVQVPIRPLLREIGHAHVTALASRPKLIGGARAQYPEDSIRKS
ncbi:TIGR01440 family protein [Streptococcus sp. oral taxon 064]|uniref:TIGR01440 family protein n=1 Tax=Streptococcus sp. oral taxon 064 TaxID=712624 RepID=UPI0008073062|nr:TIGR01440 family protein [Streptococcus sp. oral taxon 064]